MGSDSTPSRGLCRLATRSTDTTSRPRARHRSTVAEPTNPAPPTTTSGSWTVGFEGSPRSGVSSGVPVGPQQAAVRAGSLDPLRGSPAPRRAPGAPGSWPPRMRLAPRPTAPVLLVSSSGGVLLDLLGLRPWWPQPASAGSPSRRPTPRSSSRTSTSAGPRADAPTPVAVAGFARTAAPAPTPHRPVCPRARGRRPYFLAARLLGWDALGRDVQRPGRAGIAARVCARAGTVLVPAPELLADIAARYSWESCIDSATQPRRPVPAGRPPRLSVFVTVGWARGRSTG